MNFKMLLKTEVSVEPEVTKIVLTGAIDENSNLPKLPKSKTPVQIDLSGITTINSVGCREWTNWMKSLKDCGPVSLHKCPSVFISQVSILVGFLPDEVAIDSFYVPYFCESCGAEEMMLFERGRHFQDFNAINVQDQIICPVCSALMELDVMKERYFGFFKRKAA